jgi:hypothetical protein
MSSLNHANPALALTSTMQKHYPSRIFLKSIAQRNCTERRALQLLKTPRLVCSRVQHAIWNFLAEPTRLAGFEFFDMKL